jgi:ABC-2 type transport system permease protein
VKGFVPIFKRELTSLWVTPLAWVLLVSFLILQGSIFYSITVHFSKMEEAALETGPLSAYFGQQSLLMAFTLLLLCPSLTMRSLSEERRTGSIEALLSAPATPLAIVLGKYAGIFVSFVMIWLPTLLYAFVLRETGTIHLPTLATGYLGIGLVGSSYLALGVLMSALARSQLVALLLTTTCLFGLFILGIGEYIFEAGALREFSAFLSLTTLLEESSKGIIDTRRVILHVSLASWALFVSSRIVDSWRNV